MTSAVGYHYVSSQVLKLLSIKSPYLVPIASSSIVYHNIQSSKLRESPIDNGRPFGLLCDVHALELKIAGVLRSDLLSSLDIDVCDQHLCTFLAKSAGDRSAKSRATSYASKNGTLVHGAIEGSNNWETRSPVTMATLPCNRVPWDDIFVDEKVINVGETQAELGGIVSLKEHEQRGARRCSA